MTELSPEKLAKESERLRTDQPFAEAVKTIHAEAKAALAKAEHDAVAALLKHDSTEEPVSRIVQARATIAAIEALTTTIAHQILKGTPRETKPVA
ncbi:MAG TPA: hypothetical protein VMA55_15720 [Acidovorax sp.]|nr:hypothetical protein [Acidovorax sp.]